MLSRRKWQLIGVAALVCALTALVLVQLTPQYRATAYVMIDSRKAKVTNTPDVLGGITTEISALQTEIEVLKSASLLGRVVDKLHLERDEEYGAAPPSAISQFIGQVSSTVGGWLNKDRAPPRTTTPEETARLRAITTLSRNVGVAVRNRSYVIAVSIESASPAKAKQLVDTITDFYLVDQLQAKLDANKRATEFFNERLDELKQTVSKAESAAASFREKSGLTIGKDATVASQSLSELNSQLIQARTQRAEKESRLVALQQAARNPATLGGISEVLANPLISSLRAQEAEVARRIGDLNQRYGDSHPRLLQARAEQAQIQGRINAEVAKIISSVQGDAEAARSKEAELQAQVDSLEKKAGGLGQNEVQLRQYEREAQSSRAVYEDFLKRSKEIREQQDIQQPDARVLSPADLPTSPSFPRYGLIMGIALVIGLGVGVGVVLLLERLDGGFRMGEHVERMTGRAVVGMIPALSGSLLAGRQPARFVVDKPASAYGEALRSTFTAISLGTLDHSPKVLMVTSSLPGEGKSTFACSLASLLARSNPGKKIVVVDCDMRRSSVAKTLGVPAEDGTIDQYLSGDKTIEEVIRRDEASGLYFVPARSNTPNSAEILDSNAMRNFVKALSGMFDYVFLDTPPVMAVSDSRITAQLADYIVFLIRWEQTPRELAVNALNLLRDLRKHVGIVLSQVNVRRHAKYGYGDYGYYYSKYRDYYTD
jgi:exopolysaccharide transport family protein